jgi:hypothetical protein
MHFVGTRLAACSYFFIPTVNVKNLQLYVKNTLHFINFDLHLNQI